MNQFSAQKLSSLEPTPLIAHLPEVNIYSEEAVWLCENLKTNYKTRIHGALAQILKKYPNDYRLRLLSTKEPRYEHPAATGQ